MFQNTLTFKFGKTIGLFFLFCIAAGVITIIAEKLYYALQHSSPPDYGLAFAVIILLNVFVILTTNFFIVEIILFIVDCLRLKKIKNLQTAKLPLAKQIYEYLLFVLSITVPFIFFL